MVAVGGLVATAGTEQAVESCSGGGPCARPEAARNAAIVGAAGLAVSVVGTVILLQPDGTGEPSTFVPSPTVDFPDH
jgi:hypothetical protein